MLDAVIIDLHSFLHQDALSSGQALQGVYLSQTVHLVVQYLRLPSLSCSTVTIILEETSNADCELFVMLARASGLSVVTVSPGSSLAAAAALLNQHQQQLPSMHQSLLSRNRHAWQLIRAGVTLISELVLPDNALPEQAHDHDSFVSRFRIHPQRWPDAFALHSSGLLGASDLFDACRLVREHGSIEGIIAQAEQGTLVVEAPASDDQQLDFESVFEVNVSAAVQIAAPRLLQLKQAATVTPLDLPLATQPAAPERDLAQAYRALYLLRAPLLVCDLLRQNPELSGTLASESRARYLTRRGVVVGPDFLETLKCQVSLLHDVHSIKELVNNACLHKQVGFSVVRDTSPAEEGVIGFCVALSARKAFYIPCAHHTLPANRQLTAGRVLLELKPLLERTKTAKVSVDAKSDLLALMQAGLTTADGFEDISIAAYCLDSSRANTVVHLASRYLSATLLDPLLLSGKGKKAIPLFMSDVDLCARHTAEACVAALLLQPKLMSDLQAHQRRLNIYERLERPLLPVLARMECTGIHVDSAVLAQLQTELSRAAAEGLAEFHAEVGPHVNPNSATEVALAIRSTLHLPLAGKTASGALAINDKVLLTVAKQSPAVAGLLRYRAAERLLTGHVLKLPKHISRITGNIHCRFRQDRAVTGRLYSVDPNLMSTPIKTASSRRIRAAFSARRGKVIVSADYSQIELRIMAHLAGDRVMIDAFKRGIDVHKVTASEIFNIGVDEVTDEQRRIGKAVNFGMIFGISPHGLSVQLGCAESQAKTYIVKFFTRYPMIKRYMDAQRLAGPRQGFVESLHGRYMPLKRPDTKPSTLAKLGPSAINFGCQATSAEAVKKAMIELDAWIQDSGLDARMVLQVHDELVFEVSKAAANQLVDAIQRIMPAVLQLSVPLEVSVGIGPDWLSAH